jgi:hypothetical protein
MHCRSLRHCHAAAHRAQADALEIAAKAERRLADEYDAAQERGELRKAGNPIVPVENICPALTTSACPGKRFTKRAPCAIPWRRPLLYYDFCVSKPVATRTLKYMHDSRRIMLDQR